MGIDITGYVTVSTKTLREHEGHSLYTRINEGRVGLWCDRDLVMLEQEPLPDTSLECGCPDMEEHASGLALQTKFREEYRMTKSACVGCYLGDDGISLHSCYIHATKYWPEEVNA